MPNQSVPVFLTEQIAVCPGPKISGTWHDMAEDSMAWNRIGWQLSLMQCQWEIHKHKTVSTLQMQRQEHTGAPRRETCATVRGKSLTAPSFLMATCTPCQKQSELTKILSGFEKTFLLYFRQYYLSRVKPFFRIFHQQHVNQLKWHEITWNVGCDKKCRPLVMTVCFAWVQDSRLFSLLKVKSDGMWKCGTDQSGVQYKVDKIGVQPVAYARRIQE